MKPLAKWVFGALLRFAPVDGLPQVPTWEETAEQATERYASIAEDIAAAAEGNTPGWLTDRQEAALLIAIGIGESQLARDIDVGPCHRGQPDGRYWGRCDFGTSGSLWQIKRGVLWEGERLSYLELFQDRGRAARIALWAARSSLWSCRKLPEIDRLSGLSGKCQEGHAAARAHYQRWGRVVAWEAKP